MWLRMWFSIQHNRMQLWCLFHCIQIADPNNTNVNYSYSYNLSVNNSKLKSINTASCYISITWINDQWCNGLCNVESCHFDSNSYYYNQCTGSCQTCIFWILDTLVASLEYPCELMKNQVWDILLSLNPEWHDPLFFKCWIWMVMDTWRFMKL